MKVELELIFLLIIDQECALNLEKKGFAEVILSVTNSNLCDVLPLLTMAELKETAKSVGIKVSKQTSRREDLIQWLLQVIRNVFLLSL